MLEKEIKQTAKKLVAQWERISEKQRTLDEEERDILGKLKSLKAMYELLTGKELHLRLPHFATPVEPMPTEGPNAKLADAIEAVLVAEKKPLRRREIIDRLRQKNVRLSLKNPRNVVAGAISRDKRNRFVSLKDGRVTLATEGR